jgi:predicted dehydrogenase
MVTKVDNRRLKVGIISANWGVQAHLPAWRTLRDDIEVTAICTAHKETAEAAARDHNIPRAFWDYRTMCADPDLDIIDCGTRPSLRYDMVMTALRNDKHVYNGIPFSVDLPHAREMLTLQRDRKRVGVTDAFIQAIPAVARMKELIDEGFLGELYFATSYFNMQLFNQPSSKFPYVWFADKINGASALRNLGSHMLHPMVHMFGDVEEVIGQADIRRKEWKCDDGVTIRPQVFDTATAMLRFKNGGMGQIATSWVAADGPGWMLEAYGSRGRLLAHGPSYPLPNTTRLYAGPAGASYTPVGAEIEVPLRLQTVPGATLDEKAHGSPTLPMARLYADMVQAIRNGGDGAPSFAQAYHVQQIVEGIHQSLQTRSWVPMRDVQ